MKISKELLEKAAKAVRTSRQLGAQAPAVQAARAAKAVRVAAAAADAVASRQGSPVLDRCRATKAKTHSASKKPKTTSIMPSADWAADRRKRRRQARRVPMASSWPWLRLRNSL